jgi:hypothetical protein
MYGKLRYEECFAVAIESEKIGEIWARVFVIPKT